MMIYDVPTACTYMLFKIATWLLCEIWSLIIIIYRLLKFIARDILWDKECLKCTTTVGAFRCLVDFGSRFLEGHSGGKQRRSVYNDPLLFRNTFKYRRLSLPLWTTTTSYVKVELIRDNANRRRKDGINKYWCESHVEW